MIEKRNTQPDLDVPNKKEQLAARTARIKQTIQEAGGSGPVARRSGIPYPTLMNYLAGRDMKVDALVALAEACAVHVEWLATGRGEKHLDYVPPGHFQPLPPGARVAAGPVLDLAPDAERLAKAIEIVETLGDHADAADRARRIAKIYEILSAARPKD